MDTRALTTQLRLALAFTAMPFLVASGCIENNFTSPEVPVASPPIEERAVQDSYTITAKPMDILFFGDTSGSMTPELTTLGDNVTRFIERLESYGVDWQAMPVRTSRKTDELTPNGTLHVVSVGQLKNSTTSTDAFA